MTLTECYIIIHNRWGENVPEKEKFKGFNEEAYRKANGYEPTVKPAPAQDKPKTTPKPKPPDTELPARYVFIALAPIVLGLLQLLIVLALC